VIPDGTPQEMLDTRAAIAQVVEASPGGAAAAAMIPQLLSRDYHDVDLGVAGERARTGFDPDGGLAVFITGGEVVTVFSIPAPDAYRRAFGVKVTDHPSGPIDDRRDRGARAGPAGQP